MDWKHIPYWLKETGKILPFGAVIVILFDRSLSIVDARVLSYLTLSFGLGLISVGYLLPYLPAFRDEE